MAKAVKYKFVVQRMRRLKQEEGQNQLLDTFSAITSPQLKNLSQLFRLNVFKRYAVVYEKCPD